MQTSHDDCIAYYWRGSCRGLTVERDVAQWLALQTCNPKIVGSNLGSWMSRLPQRNVAI